MRILITGGAGFIGSHLAEKLLKQGHTVIIVDDLSTGREVNIPDHKDCYYLESGMDAFLANDFSYDYDQIYHLAAVVGVKRVLEKPLECINVNMKDTEELLQCCQIQRSDYKNDCKLFIASTSEVYGKNDSWSLKEDDDRITGSTQKKRWIYAETKAMDEFLANIYAEQYGMKIVIGRFFSIVGPRQLSHYGMVLPTFVQQAIKNEPITVYGDGTQIRSFMHVSDCVYLVERLMNETLGKYTGTFNVGNPDPIMIRDLAWRVKHISKSKSEIVYVPYEQAYSDGFEDMKRRVPCIDKIQDAVFLGLDYKMLDIDQIIESVIQYEKSLDENAADEKFLSEFTGE